jgi:uncharacterized protein
MISPRDGYLKRIVDHELDELMTGLAAVVLEGPKAVGKTATASRRAGTVHQLDDPAERNIALADPARLLAGAPPVLIDEWQRVPESWDLVRRAVDQGAPAGQFLLAGSASNAGSGTHSGAGRIVSARMRPLSIAERTVDRPSVSLGAFLLGRRPKPAGRTDWGLERYVGEILRSGFPGLRELSGRALRAQLDGYIARVLDRDFPDLGHPVRNREGLKRWITAYAAATSTTATFETIRSAATGGEGEKPSKTATLPYRAVLERLWILDPLPAWAPTGSHIRRLTLPPKHHLADPALASRLLGVDATALLGGDEITPSLPRDGTLLGALFESLVTLSVRVYAQAAEARVLHLRTGGGEHEIDLIVERSDGAVIGIEVKLSRDARDSDTAHLKWLQATIGDRLLDAMVITTGPEAYRRQDGIAVVPAALLGP